jgi:hypothetical protein
LNQYGAQAQRARPQSLHLALHPLLINYVPDVQISKGYCWRRNLSRGRKRCTMRESLKYRRHPEGPSASN